MDAWKDGSDGVKIMQNSDVFRLTSEVGRSEVKFRLYITRVLFLCLHSWPITDIQVHHGFASSLDRANVIYMVLLANVNTLSKLQLTTKNGRSIHY